LDFLFSLLVSLQLNLCQEETVVLFLVWLILIKCTLHRTDSFFLFRSRFIYPKSPQVTFLTESRLQVGFGPSQVGFTK